MSPEQARMLLIAERMRDSRDTDCRWLDLALPVNAAVSAGLIGGRARQAIFTASRRLADALIASFDPLELEERVGAQERAADAYCQFEEVVAKTFSGRCYPIEFVDTNKVTDISTLRKTA